MKRERILSILGYDPALLAQLSAQHRNSLRGAAISWLLASVVLGLAAAYAAWLIAPIPLAPILGGAGVMLLTINLLRVVTAGGGTHCGDSLQESEVLCRRFRPSIVPALVLGLLAAILAQPAQLAFWPDLDDEVEVHREALIEQHLTAATNLGTDADYYRDELESAGFPIFRLKLVWQSPKRAVRLTVVICLLVLLPAFWSQFISIKSVRAYEWQRCQRSHSALARLDHEGSGEVTALLQRWPGYVNAGVRRPS